MATPPRVGQTQRIMTHDKKNLETVDLDRRSFLKSGSFATFAALMGGVPLRAADTAPPASSETKSSTAPPVNFGVIGLGVRGREILKTLSIMPNAPVVSICDNFEAMIKRSKDSAPKAETCTDYKQLLANKEVQAVVVATPTHLHKDIVIDALKAGKHVYCEMPLAHTLEDAKAIALAARGAYKLNFQAGLPNRSDPQRYHVMSFIRAGSMGKTIMGRAQWHKKQSWRRASATPEREKDLNWRLYKASSTGLIGEIGIHQIDMANWVMNARPVSIVGFSGIQWWNMDNDDREVADTVQAVIEYPGGVRFYYGATLANSFDGEYDMFYGTDSAVMIRENKAWMFKEVDAPLLGWEVYARKDAFQKETGIVLMANATKLTAQMQGDVMPPTEAPLYKALEAFITNSGMVSSSVQDFVDNFGDKEKEMRDYLVTAMKSKMHAAGYKEGFEATVTAIKANEAVTAGQRIEFKPDWFSLG